MDRDATQDDQQEHNAQRVDVERLQIGLIIPQFFRDEESQDSQGHDNDQSREITRCELPYAPGVEAGVFACRSEYRPNPIGLTVCPIVDVDETFGRVVVADIDAFDGTPILDLKPYIGVTDRVREIEVPAWFDGWPEWLPDEGLGV